MIDNAYEFYEETIKRYKEGKEVDIVKLRDLLLSSDKIYSDGEETPLSDEEYDRLHQIYIELTGIVIRGDMNARAKVRHDYPQLKGTVKKVHYITREEKEKDPGAVEAHKVLYEWYLKTFNQLSHDKNHYLGFWPKYDGCSIILSLNENHEVTKAITRGDEEFGVDKSDLFNNMIIDGVIPKEYEGKIGLKTEAIMRKSLFHKYNKKFAGDKPFVNERTAMTSLLNSQHFTNIHKEFITLRPLLMYYNGGFRSFTAEDEEFGPVYTILQKAGSNKPVSEDAFKKIIGITKDFMDNNLDFACDGIIVRWYDEDAMNKELGRDEANYINNFEIAYKFPKANNYTKVKYIRQDIGIFGNASFTAVVEPIKINDKVIKNASLGPYDRAKGLALAEGDIVNIKYEIVPYLCIDDYCEAQRSGNKPIELITNCPYCGEPLVMDPELSCRNPDCPARIQGKIYNFFSRLNIAGIGESMIEALFSAGLLRSIQDIFKLKKKKDEFCSIDGFGPKTFKSICKQIEKLSSTEDQLLAAIGIKGIGPKTSKKISSIYYIDELMEICISPDGKETLSKKLTPKLTESLYKGVNDNYDLIKFLLAKVDVKKPNRKNSETLGKIAFTGFRNAEFQAYLEKLGFEVGDMRKSTDLLIAEDPNGNSSKLTKAREMNIPIISVPEAYEKFHYLESK